MPYIEPIRETDAEGTVAEVYAMARQRAGYVANIIKVMSRDGQSMQAAIQFYVALMKSPNALAPAQKEMLATVVSNANDCYY